MKKFFFLVVIVLFAHPMPSSANWDDKSIVHVSFNIDTNIGRTEEGPARDAFPEWRAGNRIPAITQELEKIISTYSPDIIHLQEGRHFITKFGDEVDSVTPLVSYLKERGYDAFVQGYNPSDRAFQYITAHKAERFNSVKREELYFTKTPDRPTEHPSYEGKTKAEADAILAAIKDNNFDEEWERCTLVTRLTEEDGTVYFTLNVHLGLGVKHRKASSDLLRQFVTNLMTREKDAKFIITGDFNTFSDWGGPEQLAILKQDDLLKHATDGLKLPTGDTIFSSFFAYPFDFGAAEGRLKSRIEELRNMEPRARKSEFALTYRDEAKSLGSLLDQVFYRGFTESKAILVPTPLYEPAPEVYDENTVKAYILDHLKDGPAFASDHQPVVTIFTK